MTLPAAAATAQAVGVAATEAVLWENELIRGLGHGGFFSHDEAVF